MNRLSALRMAVRRLGAPSRPKTAHTDTGSVAATIVPKRSTVVQETPAAACKARPTMPAVARTPGVKAMPSPVRTRAAS